ncbi:MAG: hypothetical protein Q7S08_04115 [bacterium]|nr:hypothetical protein [bacterium]
MTFREHEEWAKDQHGYGGHARPSRIHHSHKQALPDDNSGNRKRDEEEQSKKLKERRELF